MTQSISLDQSGFNNTTDPVASAGMVTFANDVEQKLEDILNGVQVFDAIKFNAASPDGVMQIDVDGAIEAPQQVLIQVQALTGATDQLDTIGVSNQRFVILQAYSTHTITIRSGTGNITTPDGTNFTLSGNLQVMLWCQGSQWSLIGPGAGILGNSSATTNPASGDDSAQGYSVGSLWENVSQDNAWLNVDSTQSAAIWKQITRPKNRWGVRAANTTATGVGIANPTLTTNTSAVVNDATNTALEMQTTTSSGNIAGLVSTSFNLVRPAHDPIFECYVKTDSTITTLRLWIGLVSADVTNVDTLAATTKFAGFRFSTNASDGGFKGCLNDGTNQEVTAALNTVAASTWYKLRMRYISGTGIVYFSVNDGGETSLFTYPPASSTDLGFVVRCITTSAANRRLDFARLEVTWG